MKHYSLYLSVLLCFLFISCGDDPVQSDAIPSAPTDFRTTDIRPTEIDLAWTASQSSLWNDFRGYVLSYNGQDISLPPTAVSCTVVGLTSGTSYTFTLKAVTTSDRESIPVAITATPHKSVRPQPPSNLEVVSRSSTEIVLRWEASPDSANPNFEGYEVTYTPGGRQVIIVDKEQTSCVVKGLSSGTVYSFTLRARLSGSLSSDVSADWAPARISQVIRLYSSKSHHGQGVDLDGDNGYPQVLTLDHADKWDLAYDDNSNYIFFGSPGMTGYVEHEPENSRFVFANGQIAKRTRFSTIRYSGVTSFEEFSSEYINEETGNGGLGVDINVSMGCIIQTQEGNYAKILILCKKGGRVIQGSGNDTYIEIQVSYQPIANVPYAIFSSDKDRIIERTAYNPPHFGQ